MKKIVFFIVSIFFTTNLFSGSWSLTRMDMITPNLIGTITSEMQSLNAIFLSISLSYKTQINQEIDKKNAIYKNILNDRVIHETLLKEINQLNKDINEMIFLKQGLTDDLSIN